MTIGTISTSLATIPIYVFTGKNFVNSLTGRHNIAEMDTVIVKSGGTKIFGFFSGGNISGGCKYSKPSVGFERDKFAIVDPIKVVENPLLGMAMSTPGAGGSSVLPTDGKKKLLANPTVNTDVYLVGNTANNYPGAGLHKSGSGNENEANALEFDLGSVQFVGTLLLYFYTPVTTPTAQARFTYFKVKVSSGTGYTYASGRPKNTSENDYGWSKSSGFPTPPSAFVDELRPTEIAINTECRYIKIYTDGSSDGIYCNTYNTNQSNTDKQALVYEVEISNIEGFRSLQKNFICLKRYDDGITDISGSDLSTGVTVLFKDVGDSAYTKITNALAYDIFIYSYELFGLWVQKASEIDNLNGSIRSVTVSPNSTDLFTENTISVHNDKIQYPEYADRLGASLLASKARERAVVSIENMPLDLLISNMAVVGISIDEFSSLPIKTFVEERSFKLGRNDCAISLKLSEDSSL